MGVHEKITREQPVKCRLDCVKILLTHLEHVRAQTSTTIQHVFLSYFVEPYITFNNICCSLIVSLKHINSVVVYLAAQTESFSFFRGMSEMPE